MRVKKRGRIEESGEKNKEQRNGIETGDKGENNETEERKSERKRQQKEKAGKIAEIDNRAKRHKCTKREAETNRVQI